MNQKLGTPRQRCANQFDKTPLTGTSLCPFKGPEIAIVPVRYALDRSRHDPNPNALKPLVRHGRWARLPPLKSRSYTLRQLHGGFVYVFNETAGTLHEYAYNADNARLQRIKWTQAHIGQDERSGTDAGRPYLSTHATMCCTLPSHRCNGPGASASTCAPTNAAASYG